MTLTVDLNDAKTDTATRRTLSDLSLSVAKCKRIVLVTGAGISCSSGIPDFRSSDGLYNLVKQRYPDVVLKGRDLFDASLFRDTTSTSVFYTFISQLKQSIDSADPTSTHRFIKTLDAKGKLLRSYTQNIDGLEERVGLVGSSSQQAKSTGKGKAKLNTKEVRNVQLHGDIHRVRCMSCSAEYPCSAEHLEIFNEGNSPECPECLQRSQDRIARSARATKVGLLRPAIVLYDEPHPLGDDIGAIQTRDLAKKPDMLIIMGTSLKVHGLKRLVKEFSKAVHANASGASTSKARQHVGKVIFVNRTPPSAEWAGLIDYHISGETDVWVDRVIDDWKKMRPADWELQQTLVASTGENTMFKVTKPTALAMGKGKGKDHKKPARVEVENVPPVCDADLSMQSPVKLPPPPSSPSKRRQGACHYSDTESSPSKRHSGTDYSRLKDAAQNCVLDVDGDEDMLGLAMDLSMHGINSPQKPKSRKMAPLPKSKASTIELADLSMADSSICLSAKVVEVEPAVIKPLPRMIPEVVLTKTKRRTLTKSRSAKSDPFSS